MWIYGCGKDNRNNAEWKIYSREVIERVIDRPVRMPDSISIYYPDFGSFRKIMGARVKVMFSVDISCGACLSKFDYWNQFINQFEQRYNYKPNVLAVIIAPNCNEETKMLITERWKYEWIYDSKDDFNFNNELDDDRFQAILLDSNDTIRVVGNPVFNDALGQLYEKTIVKYMQ